MNVTAKVYHKKCYWLCVGCVVDYAVRLQKPLYNILLATWKNMKFGAHHCVVNVSDHMSRGVMNVNSDRHEYIHMSDFSCGERKLRMSP